MKNPKNLRHLAYQRRNQRTSGERQNARHSKQQRVANDSLEAEALEARILYSAAPVEAPAADLAGADTQPAAPAQAAATAPTPQAVVPVAAPTVETTATAASTTTTQDTIPPADGDSTVPADQEILLVDVDTPATTLNQDTLQSVADAARQQWIDSGINEAQLAALDSLTYEIAELGENNLGTVSGTTVRIDADAGGSGSWFIDSTPNDNEEFITLNGTDTWIAIPGERADGSVDLLSVLLHEQGHVLGLGDSAVDTSGLMHELIGTGERHLPTTGQAEGATPDLDSEPSFVKLNDPLAAGENVHATFKISPDSTRVVYVIQNPGAGGLQEIYSRPMNGSGSAVKLNDPLPVGGSASTFFEISPDSTRVVWYGDGTTDGVAELYSRAIDGSDAQVKLNAPLTGSGDIRTDFKITADSSRVVWRADADVNDVDELYSRAIDGSGVEVKINDAIPLDVDVRTFDLSADSNRVVWTANTGAGGTGELYSRAVDGSGAQIKLGSRASLTTFTFGNFLISPDSTRVVWIADADTAGDNEIYSRAIDGSGATAKLNSPIPAGGDVQQFRITGDSAHVVWRGQGQTIGTYEIFSRSIDGTGVQVKLNDGLPAGEDVLGIAVSPDSSRAVWHAGTGASANLFSRAVDGSGTQVQLNAPLAAGATDWFQFNSDSSRVIWMAEGETAGVTELFSRAIDGSGTQVKINDDLPAGGDVTWFSIGSDPMDIIWKADGNNDGVTELFSRNVDGLGAQARVSFPLPTGGNVNSFAISSDSSRVAWTADGDTDGIQELYSARIPLDLELDGKAFADFGGNEGGITNSSERLGSAALQTDGKIVVASSTGAFGNTDFGLTRFNADGTVDTSFGTGGLVTTDVNGNGTGPGYDSISKVFVQSDGKILAIGTTTSTGGTQNDFAMVRYNSDGSIDGSFGNAGIVVSDLSVNQDAAHSAVVLPDGKIVVGGFSANAGTVFDFTLVRYNADGSIDGSFGTAGKVTTDFGTNNLDYGYGLARQTDGKLVLSGVSYPSIGGSTGDVAVARYHADGSLDGSFGTGGKAIIPLDAHNDRATSVVVQNDGKILLGGWAGASRDFMVARLNADGSLDAGFGSGGRTTTDFVFSDYGHDITLQPDGKILIAGKVGSLGTSDDFGIARYNSDGTLDATFGTGGKQTCDFFGGSDGAHTVLLDADFNILLAGFAHNGADVDFAIARFDSGLSTLSDETGISISGGDLIITDVLGGDTDDDFTISTTATTLTIVDNNGNTIDLGSVAGTGDGTDTVTINLTEFAGGIVLDTLDGNDILRINFDSGNFGRAVTFNGGDQTAVSPATGDQLFLDGGAIFANATFNYTNENDGNIGITGNSLITYTGLEPITSTISATDVTLNYSDASETITVTDGGGGQTIVDSTAGEITTFNHPGGLLTINAGDGDDIIDFRSLGAGFAAGLNVAGQKGHDQIKYSASATLGNGHDGNFTAERIRFVNGSLATTDGDINLTGTGGGAASFNGVLLSGASLASTSGDINLIGQGGDSGSANSGVAILVNTATTSASHVSTGGSGIITIDGTGGSVGAYAHGVEINRSSVTSTSNAVIAITINGTGGVGGNADYSNAGITGYYATITTTNGGIDLDGIADSTTTSYYNAGVSLIGSTVSGTTLDVSGTGGGGSYYNRGIFLSSGSDLDATGGNATLTGDSANNNSGSYNEGIYIEGSSVDASGKVTLGGEGSTGASNASSNSGVYLFGGTASGGTGLVITGTGGTGSGGYNYGVNIYSSTAAGGTGAVTIDGTADSTTGGYNNIGSNVQYSTVSGASLDIDGTGGGGSWYNRGVMTVGGSLDSTSGGIDIEGDNTNNHNGGYNDGVYMQGTATTASGGKLSIDGTGSTSTTNSTGNNGVYLYGGSADGDGGVEITGIGGTGSGGSNFGTSIHYTSIDSGSNDVTITGTADTTATGSYNVGAGVQYATLSGNRITIDGTGGGGAWGNRGVLISGGSITASATTDEGITITGDSANNTSGGGNDGVQINTASLTAANSKIDINGDGSTGVTNTSANNGTYLSGATLNSKELEISGTGGGGSGGFNYGIYLYGGSITTTGNATTQLNGNGGTGVGGYNYGAYIYSASIAANNSTLDIDGTASSNNTGTTNAGVGLLYSTLTGDAVMVTGIGGSGTDYNRGIYLVGGSITADNGNAQLDGTANPSTTGADNEGLNASGASITSTSGQAILEGNGSTSASNTYNSHGLYLYSVTANGSAGTTITGNGGRGTSGSHSGATSYYSSIGVGTSTTTITGIAHASAGGSYNIGTSLQYSTVIGSNLAINGTGGAGTDHNRGVYIVGGTTKSIGDTTIVGMTNNATSGWYNHGVDLQSAEVGGSTSTAITGDGGGGLGFNHGIYMYSITTFGTTPFDTNGSKGDGSYSEDEAGNFFP